jgi:hypothetical protein
MFCKHAFMKKLFVGLVIVTFPLVFASCNGVDSGGGSGDTESGQTSAILKAVSGNVTMVNSSKAPAFQTGDHGIYTVNQTAYCTLGGTATITGTLQGSSTGTYPNDTMTLSYSYSMIFNQCVSTGDDGKNYQISGTGINVMGSSNWQNSGTVQNIYFSGKDNFSIDGNIVVDGDDTLNCDISLSESTSTIEQSGSFTETGSYNGSICGQAANGSIDYTGSITSN